MCAGAIDAAIAATGLAIEHSFGCSVLMLIAFAATPTNCRRLGCGRPCLPYGIDHGNAAYCCRPCADGQSWHSDPCQERAFMGCHGSFAPVPPPSHSSTEERALPMRGAVDAAIAAIEQLDASVWASTGDSTVVAEAVVTQAVTSLVTGVNQAAAWMGVDPAGGPDDLPEISTSGPGRWLVGDMPQNNPTTVAAANAAEQSYHCSKCLGAWPNDPIPPTPTICTVCFGDCNDDNICYDCEKAFCSLSCCGEGSFCMRCALANLHRESDGERSASPANAEPPWPRVQVVTTTRWEPACHLEGTVWVVERAIRECTEVQPLTCVTCGEAPDSLVTCGGCAANRCGLICAAVSGCQGCSNVGVAVPTDHEPGAQTESPWRANAIDVVDGPVSPEDIAGLDSTSTGMIMPCPGARCPEPVQGSGRSYDMCDTCHINRKDWYCQECPAGTCIDCELPRECMTCGEFCRRCYRRHRCQRPAMPVVEHEGAIAPTNELPALVVARCAEACRCLGRCCMGDLCCGGLRDCARGDTPHGECHYCGVCGWTE